MLGSVSPISGAPESIEMDSRPPGKELRFWFLVTCVFWGNAPGETGAKGITLLEQLQPQALQRRVLQRRVLQRRVLRQ
jgi:hypothetical protein